MIAAFVVRLLDADDNLLSWARVSAQPKPQEGRASCPFFSPTITRFVVERTGTVAKLAVHWTDLDIARVREMPATEVFAGQVFDFAWIEPVWLVAGMKDVVLPPVTEHGAISITPPTGALVGKDPRT